MPTYISLLRYTEDGIKKIKESPTRLERAHSRIAVTVAGFSSRIGEGLTTTPQRCARRILLSVLADVVFSPTFVRGMAASPVPVLSRPRGYTHYSISVLRP